MIKNLIVFEGIDGSGKSSQILRVKDWLEKQGYSVWCTKEPTEGPIGKLIRDIQTKKVTLDCDVNSKTFKRIMRSLYSADRYSHIEEMKNHKEDFILCDRYKYSTCAYQFLDYETWDYLDDFESPILTIWIDVPVEEALKRVSNRSDLEIFETKEYLTEVRGIYEDCWGEISNFWRVDGNKSREEVTDEIVEVIKKKILNKEVL